MSNSNDLLVTHNWMIENNKDIRDSLSFSKNFTLENNELEEIVRVETCIHFMIHDENKDCSNLILDFKSRRFSIYGLTIVSEARIIELYGKNGEYDSTHHGELLDDFQDMLVYVTKFKFLQPLPNFSIKFAGLKQRGSIWIYGMKLFTQDINPGHSEIHDFTKNTDLLKLLESQSSSLKNPMITSIMKGFLTKQNKDQDCQENKNINYLILKKLSFIEQHIQKENELNILGPLIKRFDNIAINIESKLNKLEERISYLENKEKERFDSIESLLKEIKENISQQ